MSERTPDYIVRAIANNANGIGVGPTVTRKEWQALATDLGGWFMWWGKIVDMRAVSIGGGMYQIRGKIRE